MISINYKVPPPSEHISQAIKDRIVSGQYPPRSVISEKEICQEFGVSRTPFREAIKKLEEMRLVEVVPRFGTYVSDVNFHEVKNAFEVRLALEPWACKLAAERRTDEQLMRLEDLIEEDEVLIKKGESVLLTTHIDRRCHAVIEEAAHNPLLAADLDKLRTICSRVWTSSFREKLSISELSAHWRKIHQAIRDKNGPSASAAMTEHIEYTLNCLKDAFFSNLER
jgi:GntR family transcriptional regulator, rspAB operon transcriptional repressor